MPDAAPCCDAHDQPVTCSLPRHGCRVQLGKRPGHRGVDASAWAVDVWAARAVLRAACASLCHCRWQDAHVLGRGIQVSRLPPSLLWGGWCTCWRALMGSWACAACLATATMCRCLKAPSWRRGSPTSCRKSRPPACALSTRTSAGGRAACSRLHVLLPWVPSSHLALWCRLALWQVVSEPRVRFLWRR